MIGYCVYYTARRGLAGVYLPVSILLSHVYKLLELVHSPAEEEVHRPCLSRLSQRGGQWAPAEEEKKE